MTLSHQEKSRLQIQKVAERSLNSSQNWLDSSRDYASKDLFQVLILAALERSSVEDISYSLRELGKAPSPDTVMRALNNKYGQLDRSKVEQHIASLLQQQVQQLPHFKGKKRPKVVIAIDLHDEEYYGKALYDQSGNRLVFYTKKHGKSDQALRYATLSIVSMDTMFHQPLTICFGINYVGQPRDEVVKNLLSQINLPLKIDRILLDGGFASEDVFQYLDGQRYKWIARGRYSSKKDYLGDINEEWFPYYLNNSYPVAAYLVDQDQPNGETENVLLLCSRFWTPTPAKTKELYRKRFRIENTYRHARAVKIRTSTRNIQLRWIMWAISHFLELFWQLIRYVHNIQDMDKYLCRQKRVNRILIMLLELQFLQLQYHCQSCFCEERR